MNEKKQPSNRQLKVGQQIRFLVSNFFIKVIHNKLKKNIANVLNLLLDNNHSQF